jgi:DHA2 family multidrug resistance protein
MTLQFVLSPKFAEKRKASDVDWYGILLLAITVGSLQYILERGHEEDWFDSKIILFLTVSAVIGFLLFLWRELTYKYPIVELRVLKNGNLRIGTAMSFILGFGLYGSTFIVPLYTQSILGWTALQSGALMIPAALTTAVMMPIIGKLLTRGVKQQILVSLGLLIFFIYSFWGYNILTPNTGKSDFFWMLIVRGMGLGLLFIPITSLALSTLKGQEIGQGAAFTGMMRQLGGSFGIAAITTFIANQTSIHRANLAQYLDENSFDVQQRLAGLKASFMSKGFSPDVALQSAYKVLDLTVLKQASVLSYMDVFLYLGLLFLVCIPFVLFVKEKKGREPIDLGDMH